MKAASLAVSALGFAVAVALLFAAIPAGAVDPVTGKPCYECHPGKLLGQVLHGPIKNKECEGCHNSSGGNHRRQKGLFGPKAAGSKLCYQCHQNLSLQKSVHGPIKAGTCSGCHAPHSSPYPKLLRGEGNEFCFGCHGTMKAAVSFTHRPVKSGGCQICHLPHQSTEPKLLKPAKSGICLECHDKGIATGISVHAPVANRQCGGCHAPHGGNFPKLLKAPASAPAKSAPLCYLCHKNLAEQKSVHLPVREGDCARCHLPHSSPYGKLLRGGENATLCYSCHDKKPFGKRVAHGPVKEGRCLDCHSPHQSEKAKLIKASPGLICYECHEESLAQGQSVHKPVATGECSACHMVHGSDNAKLLKPEPVVEGKTVSFCYNCHQNLAVEKSVHLPVKQGNCTGCHVVHSSPSSRLLKAEGKSLCFRCHEKQPFIQAFPHKPVADGNCTSCHLPHQSASAKLLKSKAGEVACFECHDKALASGASVHKPVAAGDCSACHLVHGGKNRKLLVASFPVELHTPYEESTYAFCFKCHDSKAFSETKTRATGFRNGLKNLHEKHVRAHSCKICHDVHASSQQRLVRDKLQGADGFEYTMKFSRSAEGGSCATNCHDTKQYVRE